MKSKHTYILSGAMAVLLCAIFVCGTLLPASGEGNLPSLNYGNPSMENNKTLSAVQLYQQLISQTMTEGERLYWSASELSMQYNAFIPDNRISTDYNGDEGVLTVTMRPHTYVAENGAEVHWLPTGAMIDGVSYELTETDGVYGFCVRDLVYSGDFEMEVYYRWEVEIPTAVIEALHNEAYQKGHAAYEEMQSYHKKMNIYQQLLAEYNAWVSYGQWEKDYADYCAEMAVYSKLKEVYDAYVVEYEAYAKVQDAYDQWQNYFDQMEAFSKNEVPYAKYQDYYSKYSAAVNKLAMFESIFIREERGWKMYGDIMGDAVTAVLAEQDLLIMGGCNASDITLAGDATENLRALLKPYNDLRNAKYSSEHQKYRALYTYYSKNYDALTTNFCDLYKTLKALYDDNPLVQRHLREKGKAEHYRQLVGHLYVVSTCLDINGYRSNTWEIAGRSLMQVIDQVHYFEDGDWNPAHTAFPEQEVAKVERIERPEYPTVVQPEFEPTPPPVVENPGDGPAFVANPYDSPRPQEVPHPGKAPEAPVLDSMMTVLMNEVRDGVLKEYDGVAKPKKMSFETSLMRTVSIKNLKTVSFYNVDGSLLHQLTLNYGDSFSYPMPTRPDTAGFSYRPLGWVSLDGSDPDFSFVTGDLSLYPKYEATRKSYTVTWVVDGVSYSSVMPYGSVPVPGAQVPINAWETQYYRYEFSGWDHEVTPVEGNVTYIGTMQKIPKKFEVTWYVHGQIVTEEWTYGETPVFHGELAVPSDQFVYTFLGWDKIITPVQGDVTYTAKYTATPLALGGANEVLQVEHNTEEIKVLTGQSSIDVREAARLAQREGKALSVVWEGGISLSFDSLAIANYLSSACNRIVLQQTTQDGRVYYRLHFYNGQWQDLNDANFEVQIALPYYKDANVETRFELQMGDRWTFVESDTLRISGSIALRTCSFYAVKSVASELCNVSKLTKGAMAGETVSLNIPCVYGYEVVGAVLVNAAGEETVVSGTSFVMPSEAVTVRLVIEKIVYRVQFLLDGTVWNTAEYELGEEILLPKAPTKQAEEGYIYTFIGWGDVPSTASGDERELTFEAQFFKSRLDIDYTTGNNNNVLLGVVLPCVGGGMLLIAGGLITWRIRRKKRCANVPATAKTPEADTQQTQ